MILRTSLSVMLIFWLAACGGGGGSGGSTPTTGVSGTAVKGVVAFAIAEAFEVVDGVVQSEPLGSTFTDENGDFELSFASGFSGLLKVVVRADGSRSTMRCDSADGCDPDGDGTADVLFGENFPLSPTFSLSLYTVVGENAGAISRNPTALTELAARLAESNPNGLNETSVEGANSQVADLFDLTGDLTALDIADVTNAEALGGLDRDVEKRASLLAAGVLGAADSAYPGETLEAALELFVEDFVRNDGQLLFTDTDDSTISLEDILDETDQVVGRIPFGTDLGAVPSVIANDRARSGSELPGEFTEATPSPEAGGEALAQAKQFARDVRDLVNATNLGPLETEAVDFGDQIADAAELVNDDATRGYSALDLAVRALFEAGADLLTAEDLPIDAYLFYSSDGFRVMVDPAPAENGNAGTLGLQDVIIDGTNINLEATLSGSYESTEIENGMLLENGGSRFDSESVLAVAANATLSGTLENEGLRMTLEGSAAAEVLANDSVTEVLEEVVDDTLFLERVNDSGRIEVRGVEFALGVQLVQLRGVPIEGGGTEPTFNFEGELSGSLGVFTADYESEYFVSDICDPGCRIDDGEDDFFAITFDRAILRFDGSLDNGAGDRFEARITANVRSNGFVLERTESFRLFETESGFLRETSSSGYNSETDSTFVSGDLAIDLRLALDGISDETRVSFTAARTARKAVEASLVVRWNGRSLDLDFIADRMTDDDSASVRLRATNQDGILLTLEDTDELVIGWLEKDGDRLATIENGGDDLRLIRYSDGSFESIF